MSITSLPLARVSLLLVLVAAVAAVAALATVQAQGNDNDGRESVCHLPGGDAGKARTMQVDSDGLAQHLEHGDSEGECDLAALAGLEVVPDGYVLICHVPAGNPANAHELMISDAAEDDHLAHGDEFEHCAAFGASTTIEPRVAGPADGALVCHKGRTRMLSEDAAADHTGHGDELGACS